MSSTSRGGKRSPADYYGTPTWPVKRLLERVPLPGGRWLEFMAGKGNIIRAVNSVRSDVQWDAIELREECRPLLTPLARTRIGSFFDCPPPPYGQLKVSISNVAFSIAMEAIQHSLLFSPVVVHLLRLNYLGTEDRNEFFQQCMPDVYVIPDRVSFAKSLSCANRVAGVKVCDWAEIVELTEDRPAFCPKCKGGKIRVSTADSIEYAWFVWTPERNRRSGKVEVLAHTPLHERQEHLIEVGEHDLEKLVQAR